MMEHSEEQIRAVLADIDKNLTGLLNSSDSDNRFVIAADVVEQLPTLLRETRKHRGLGYHAAAGQMNVNINTFYRFETGRSKGITTEHLVKMIRWLAGPPRRPGSSPGEPDPAH